jgi:hypothetical protein
LFKTYLGLCGGRNGTDMRLHPDQKPNKKHEPGKPLLVRETYGERLAIGLMQYVRFKCSCTVTNTCISKDESYEMKQLPSHSHISDEPFWQMYAKRLARYLHLHVSSYMVAFVYVDRLYESDVGKTYYKGTNAYVKIYAIVLTFVIKYLEDDVHATSYIADVTGMSIADYKRLEFLMLKAFDYRLYVSSACVKNIAQSLKDVVGDSIVSDVMSSNFY